MLLFIHGSGATNSLWIPQIRGVLSLEDQDLSDKYLLELFTISLPGHPKDDRYFDIEDVVKIIHTAILEKRAKQLELADKLMFSKNKEAVEAIKSSKVTLIGHSLGGVAALAYSFRNLNNVEKIILVSCAFSFSKSAVRLLDILYNKFIFNIGIKGIQALFRTVRDIRLKTILSICLENPEKKGLKSCTKICYEYSFDRVYKLLSLDEQLKFSQIPILGIGGKRDRLVTPNSYLKLKKYLDNQDKFLSTKKILIEDTHKPELNNFSYTIYPGGHEPMDNHRVRFVREVREFLADK
jgi:pimeloyl-ACP methyl ester carboxylesterase